MLNPLGQALLSMLQSSSTQGQALWLKRLVGLVEHLKYPSVEISLSKDEMLILLRFFFPIKKPFNIPGSAWSFSRFRLCCPSRRWDPTSQIQNNFHHQRVLVISKNAIVGNIGLRKQPQSLGFSSLFQLKQGKTLFWVFFSEFKSAIQAVLNSMNY